MVEQALRESEQHYCSVAQSANDAIVPGDAQGQIISLEQGLRDHFWPYGSGNPRPFLDTLDAATLSSGAYAPNGADEPDRRSAGYRQDRRAARPAQGWRRVSV